MIKEIADLDPALAVLSHAVRAGQKVRKSVWKVSYVNLWVIFVKKTFPFRPDFLLFRTIFQFQGELRRERDLEIRISTLAEDFSELKRSAEFLRSADVVFQGEFSKKIKELERSIKKTHSEQVGKFQRF